MEFSTLRFFQDFVATYLANSLVGSLCNCSRKQSNCNINIVSVRGAKACVRRVRERGEGKKKPDVVEL